MCTNHSLDLPMGLPLNIRKEQDVCVVMCRGDRSDMGADFDIDYIGHNYIDHNYLGQNYVDRKCIGHCYVGKYGATSVQTWA